MLLVDVPRWDLSVKLEKSSLIANICEHCGIVRSFGNLEYTEDTEPSWISRDTRAISVNRGWLNSFWVLRGCPSRWYLVYSLLRVHRSSALKLRVASVLLQHSHVRRRFFLLQHSHVRRRFFLLQYGQVRRRFFLLQHSQVRRRFFLLLDVASSFCSMVKLDVASFFC